MHLMQQEEGTQLPRSAPLTPDEVAKLLRVEYSTVITWLQRGRLKGTKLHRVWRIYPEDLQAFIDQGWNRRDTADMISRRTQAS